MLIMDGCNGQVRAAKDLLESIFSPKGIDIIKGSAQCSPSQNPLDCMRSFMHVKKSKPTWTWSTATGASDEMNKFIDKDFKKTLGNCSQTDMNSFILSLLHLETTLSSCFTIKIMQSGWAKAGLIGLELNQIMSHWIGWKMLSAESVQGAALLLLLFDCLLLFDIHFRYQGLVACIFSRMLCRRHSVGCHHAIDAAVLRRGFSSLCSGSRSFVNFQDTRAAHDRF
jgi:hypothetical protein